MLLDKFNIRSAIFIGSRVKKGIVVDHFKGGKLGRGVLEGVVTPFRSTKPLEPFSGLCTGETVKVCL